MEGNQQLQVTMDFDLPIGYTDPQGNLHRHINMRRVKGCDIEGLAVDQELKQVRGGQSYGSDEGTIGQILSMGPVYKIYAYLFGRVVISLGDLPKAQINRKLFSELYNPDITCFFARYNEFNNEMGSTKAITCPGCGLAIPLPEQPEGGENPFGG